GSAFPEHMCDGRPLVQPPRHGQNCTVSADLFQGVWGCVQELFVQRSHFLLEAVAISGRQSRSSCWSVHHEQVVTDIANPVMEWASTMSGWVHAADELGESFHLRRDSVQVFSVAIHHEAVPAGQSANTDQS